MNYYFLPRLPGLNGFVSLANFPPVGTPPRAEKIAHVAWADGEVWHFRDLGAIQPGQSSRFTSNDLATLCPPEEDASLFLFLADEALDPTAPELPTDGRPDTVPAWRANIGMSSQHTSTSYQGEYPEGMTYIPQGNLISFTPFIQMGPKAKTKLLFVNLKRKPSQTCREIGFADARTRQEVLSVPVRENSINVASLNELPDSDAGIWVTYAREIAGIPLYLSHDPEFRQMSFEHTHPPTEMLIFGDRGQAQRDIKSWWLSKIGETA